MGEGQAGPVDVCRYGLPGHPEWEACIAFHLVTFTPRSIAGAPLSSAVSCRHLTAGERAEGTYYRRCALGDEAARKHYIGAGLRAVGGGSGRITSAALVPAARARQALLTSGRLGRRSASLRRRSRSIVDSAQAPVP